MRKRRGFYGGAKSMTRKLRHTVEIGVCSEGRESRGKVMVAVERILQKKNSIDRGKSE